MTIFSSSAPRYDRKLSDQEKFEELKERGE